MNDPPTIPPSPPRLGSEWGRNEMERFRAEQEAFKAAVEIEVVMSDAAVAAWQARRSAPPADRPPDSTSSVPFTPSVSVTRRKRKSRGAT